MNRPINHRDAGCSPVPASQTAGAPPSPFGVPATFSLIRLNEDGRKFEKSLTDEAELDYLLNIVDNLLLVPCGSWAEECLRAFKADLECASENEVADRPFVKRVVL